MAAPTRAEIDAIYREAVHLADQARGWFDGAGLAWRRSLSVDEQAQVAIASLATTARLMATIAWALDPAQMRPGARALFSGAGFFAVDARGPGRLLADTPGGRIVAAAQRLFERIAALETAGSE